jgi:sugar lactone lactonase YvrE
LVRRVLPAVAALVVLLGLVRLAKRPPRAPLAPGLEPVTGAEGLVIDADGNVYFSQPMAVGRLARDKGAHLEEAWVRLPGANQVLGLAIDRARGVLYAGSPTTRTIYRISLGGAPLVSAFVTDAGEPNGLTMGPDGALYYTDFTDAGAVYRVTSEGARTKLTAAPLALPNGLAFGPDGALYVDLFKMGAVVKLTLTAGVEASRATFVAPGTLPYADGLAFDAHGNAYVGYGDGVARVSPDGTSWKRLTRGGTANVEFGAGAIDRSDLYAVTAGQVVRIATDVVGAAVPWHATGR